MLLNEFLLSLLWSKLYKFRVVIKWCTSHGLQLVHACYIEWASKYLIHAKKEIDIQCKTTWAKKISLDAVFHLEAIDLLKMSMLLIMTRLQAVVRPLLDENLQISLILQVERKTIVVSPHDLHDFLLLVC